MAFLKQQRKIRKGRKIEKQNAIFGGKNGTFGVRSAAGGGAGS